MNGRHIMKSGKEVIFGDKTLSSLFEDIYKTAIANRGLLTTAINDLRQNLKSKNTQSEDISYIGGVISDLFDTTVKNDEHLIKLATVVQKILMVENRGREDDRELLTEHEKRQLLESAKEEMGKIKEEVDDTSTFISKKSLLVEDKLN